MIHTFHLWLTTRVDARPFGLMRIAWAAITFVWMSLRLPDVAWLYSSTGMLSSEVRNVIYRDVWRFSLLDVVTDPTEVVALYVLMLAALVAVLVGYRTRIATLVSVLLLFSFHEGNPLPLGGGDTVLRTAGFLLLICPEPRMFSLDRWLLKSKDLPTVGNWIRFLVLWQLIWIYLGSGIEKLRGTMWLAGNAPAITLHHPQLSRLPENIADLVSGMSVSMTVAVLVFEFAWVLLLLPETTLHRLSRGLLRPINVKWALCIGGLVFHGAIFALMNVGVFSFAILAMYPVLLAKRIK